MEKVLDFFRESKAELRKVTWPTKKQVWVSTGIVVVLTLAVGAYLFVVDLVLTTIFTAFLS